MEVVPNALPSLHNTTFNERTRRMAVIRRGSLFQGIGKGLGGIMAVKVFEQAKPGLHPSAFLHDFFGKSFFARGKHHAPPRLYSPRAAIDRGPRLAHAVCQHIGRFHYCPPWGLAYFVKTQGCRLVQFVQFVQKVF
jgi:hypothetical protein